ncbi:hypothetical protein [Actibacterium sp. 188UL27-1]|uniref:hypothetical protein n=1 Tax=Actibacterium sp. 188UL27-1 TaxID=2786961 RepID=UPI00195CC830|nr:hypothetical protein [Actibacterium sp. 188UL27-1]MBM7067439.1 hypothetical protein [Actibacterium sp. 188UL27-1]
MTHAASHGFDEACAADLAAVVEARNLPPSDAAWLARAVAGAIRPSRDRPLWDMAHAIAAIGGDPADIIDLVLNPQRTSASALRAHILSTGRAQSDDKGLALGGAAPWHGSWTGLARSFALLEFLLTADELARFADITALLSGLADPAAAPDTARRLAAMMTAYRADHMPLAPFERRFTAIRGFLRQLGRTDSYNDDDILTFWQGGEDALFTTIVAHFVTYDRVAAELGALTALQGADYLSGIENWEDRLEAITLPDTQSGAVEQAMATLSDLAPGTPKVLTGAERDTLLALLSLDPFHANRPLTVLRALAFGRIQSGIGNRLRRGSGGADLPERVTCADADYSALLARARSLTDHLKTCITIALTLRGATGEVAQAGERNLARMRRAGFDAPRDQLARAVAAIDAALATATTELAAHCAAVERLAERTPLGDLVERDRASFAATFTALYLEGHSA